MLQMLILTVCAVLLVYENASPALDTTVDDIERGIIYSDKGAPGEQRLVDAKTKKPLEDETHQQQPPTPMQQSSPFDTAMQGGSPFDTPMLGGSPFDTPMLGGSQFDGPMLGGSQFGPPAPQPMQQAPQGPQQQTSGEQSRVGFPLQLLGWLGILGVAVWSIFAG